MEWDGALNGAWDGAYRGLDGAYRGLDGAWDGSFIGFSLYK